MVLGLATWVVLAGSVAHAAVIVVPQSLAATEGNSANLLPFSIGAAGLSSQRYQQVFAASAFAPLSGPHFITHLAFRPESGVGHAFSSTISNLQINLSTTRAPPMV
jgi:hypothetical protein